MNSRLGFAPILAMAISGAIFSGSGISAQVAPPQPPQQRPSGPIEVNGIAAKVNGRVITKNQVSFMLAPVYAQLVTQFPRRGPQFETKFKESKSKIIQELIDRQIILDEFKQLGAFIKPNLIDEEIKRQMRELYNGDEAKFRQELKNSRLTMEGYREMTREKMVVQAMRAQQFADAPPPLPNEIQKEYDEIKLTLRDVSKDKITFQKIFIPASDPQNPLNTPETQLAVAEDVAKQISDGKDFTELAKQFSKDAFAADGGIQKDVPRADLSPEFASIVFETPVGKVAGPLLDPQGFTIVKPITIDFGPSPPLDNEVRQMVEQQVSRKKTSAQYEHWIESKRKRAMVVINP
ncbi:MAG: SurA N-terminal domain-containing protein [Luteolibacter sp.]|uniref:SurA N-terminal domain-containing protein n=1 Tax=Luteolibacter sp. TaxID=1962973 RepID=UPI003266841B